MQSLYASYAYNWPYTWVIYLYMRLFFCLKCVSFVGAVFNKSLMAYHFAKKKIPYIRQKLKQFLSDTYSTQVVEVDYSWNSKSLNSRNLCKEPCQYYLIFYGCGLGFVSFYTTKSHKWEWVGEYVKRNIE